MEKSLVVGLMTGTSMDGCDAALVEIEGEGGRITDVRPVRCLSLPMPDDLRARAMACCSLDKSDIRLTCSFNVEFGHYLSQAVKAVCADAGVDPRQLLCVGSHGQTVYHIPVDEAGYVASTLQLGEPAIIAYETGAPVVSSFRAMDMAAGGRGAPLVPLAEFLIYRRDDRTRALQNLGGIGNVTLLPKGCALDDVFAFDTGPANMVINALMEHFYGLPFDEGGQVAARGVADEALLAEWMAIPFVRLAPPKATGRELYGVQFTKAEIARHPNIAPADFVATATLYTARCMQENYRLFLAPRARVDEVILGGGGSHNATLRRMIERLLPDCRVTTQQELGFDTDAKEAVAFAVLAHETMRGRPGNVPSATGATRQVVLGSVTRG